MRRISTDPGTGVCHPDSCFFKELCSTLKPEEHPAKCTLADCSVGEKKTVHFICPRNKLLSRKLTSMGLISGVEVEVLGTAPFQDPILVSLGQVRLALRRDEAALIEIK